MTAPAMTLVGMCPDCGKPLRVRSNQRNGSAFVGCSSWPECHYTAPVLDALAAPLAELERVLDAAKHATRKADDLRDHIDRRVRELICTWHPDRDPAPLEPGRVVAELTRLRAEVQR